MANTKKAETTEYKSSWDFLRKFNAITDAYSSLGSNAIFDAFTRAGLGFANMPSVQNARVKAISTLPADYSKEELGEMLVNPASSEQPLRAISEVLNYSNYSTYKIKKSYADMLTYRYYVKPLYVDGETARSKEFKREFMLVDKINKALNPEAVAHKACRQALDQEKVFYTLRYKVDKAHNEVDYIFAQQLPTDWCKIIGFNNISKYTISFDMMYFMQVGTDWTQYGDLFEPFINDFQGIIEYSEKPANPRFIYAEKNSYTVNPDKLRVNAEGNPRMFMQNGRWCYYVSLPIDKVCTFEINDASPIAVPFMSGLMQTFAQQADYEAAQYALTTLPLMMIFTGSIPYYDKNGGATTEDRYMLSKPALDMFTAMFDMLMSQHNTGGTAFYGAPFNDIRSHNFPEASNSNSVSAEFLRYGVEKSGIQALVPITDNPHQGTAQYSSKLESRFADRVYTTLENMVNNLYEKLNLKYEWQFVCFGDIYGDDQRRANAEKALANGDLSQYFVLCALDNMSVLDKLSMSHTVKESGFLDLLTPPQTAYTQSKDTKTTASESTGTKKGAPTKTEVEVQETEREKQAEGEETGRN